MTKKCVLENKRAHLPYGHWVEREESQTVFEYVLMLGDM